MDIRVSFRSLAGVTVVSVLCVAVLAGCAPAAPAASPGQTSTAGATNAPAPGESGTAWCSQLPSSAFGGLTTTAIGKAYVAGSAGAQASACWYPTGKNAGATGSSIEMLPDDNVLIDVISIDASGQYAQATAAVVSLGGVVPISGVGDKASYNVSQLTNGVPQLYALKGSVYCHVQVHIDSDELVSSDPATVAKAEGELCQAAFSG